MGREAGVAQPAPGIYRVLADLELPANPLGFRS